MNPYSLAPAALNGPARALVVLRADRESARRCRPATHKEKEFVEMCHTNRLTFFLTGLGIGSVAGLLLAPMSGNRMRNRLGEMANQVNDGLREQAENLGRVAGKTKSTADKAVEKSRDAVHGVGRTMEEKGRQLQEV
jgi:gas vesicle protein